jgi:hypothetical protein
VSVMPQAGHAVGIETLAVAMGQRGTPALLSDGAGFEGQGAFTWSRWNHSPQPSACPQFGHTCGVPVFSE